MAMTRDLPPCVFRHRSGYRAVVRRAGQIYRSKVCATVEEAVAAADQLRVGDNPLGELLRVARRVAGGAVSPAARRQLRQAVRAVQDVEVFGMGGAPNMDLAVASLRDALRAAGAAADAVDALARGVST